MTDKPYTLEEICKHLGVPAHKVTSLPRATFRPEMQADIEELARMPCADCGAAYILHPNTPWCGLKYPAGPPDDGTWEVVP